MEPFIHLDDSVVLRRSFSDSLEKLVIVPIHSRFQTFERSRTERGTHNPSQEPMASIIPQKSEERLKDKGMYTSVTRDAGYFEVAAILA